MQREYHECWVRMGGHYRWLLWFTNDIDGVETAGGRILVFQNRETLRRFALKLGATVKESHQVHDFDVAVKLGNEPTPAECRMALDVWNRVEDFAQSLGVHSFAGSDAAAGVYEKLLQGSTLPDVPSGPPQPVVLNGRELDIILRVTSEGARWLEQGHRV